jgi:hypothetical protein
MKNESYLVRKEQCPRCKEIGNDKSMDNLAVYSDGHTWCFSCGFGRTIDRVARWTQEQTYSDKEGMQGRTVFLPGDCDTNYPTRALDWCRAYEILRTDLLNQNVLWSEQEQRLIFPVYGDGFLIAYQGRDFSLNKEEKRPKWFGRGNLKDTFNILGKGTTLVLTEDIVSAIKVAKCGVQAMPLYGSFVGVERFKRLYKLFGKTVDVFVWLDPDKRNESLAEYRRGCLMGLRCNVLFSDKDPKEHNYDEIKEFLGAT